MFPMNNLEINNKGHLSIGGADTVSLAEKYGTPLYVMDENIVRENIRSFKSSIEKYYGGAGQVFYAGKVFSCMEMLRIVAEEGAGLDAVSGGELYTAIKAGFPMDKVCLHGNDKTEAELTLALENGVGRIAVDNIGELLMLSEICRRMSKKADVFLRIKPGIDAHTHSFIRTGQIDSKFGFALETGEAMEAVKKALSVPEINLKGLHCHIGSQIFDVDPFVCTAEVMLKFISSIKKETGAEIEELDLGGGFGIKYKGTDNPPPYDEYMKKVSEKVREVCKSENISQPYIIIEPGRSIAGPAGLTLYTVGGIKHIPNIRTYVSVDGGMGDNPRYILYQAEYEAVIANKAAEPKSETVTVAGKCCESGDLIGEGMSLQKAQAGDIMAVFATGAYNYSMSSNYNRNPRPPVVMVKDGESRLIVKGETFDDIIRNDC